ncbi:hypothetical protein RvY_12813 [Ramazzottius varieornatus]|uniref:Uncharacterized protein n=1 Tax=Ramazzottius varieornatus TaxID=947166 RepID=A0A1D1VUF5_RAMVA|nr:hypothetical protein RvY_12813 [Ramazzottius varieornatus]
MVIPMGNLSKVQDFYTRDHGTPREDAVYDGTHCLTAAVFAITGQIVTNEETSPSNIMLSAHLLASRKVLR